MAKKPARKSRPDVNGSVPKPTKAIEPKPDPLLTDPAIHADLKPLFDAMVMVSVWSSALARCYPDLLAQKESHGLPTADEWPDSPALERNRAQHAEWAKATREEYAARGESVAVADFLEPRWTKLMREWSGYYRDWCAAIAKAKELAKSPAVAAIMDAGESRPAHRWTTQAIIDLDNLAGTLHPIQTGGVDGLGFIRCGLPPLPQGFRTHAEAVEKRIGELRSIPDSAVPSTPAVSLWPERFQDKRVALLSAPGIDTADPRAVLERFRDRLIDWDFNRKLGEQLRHTAREPGASEPDKASVDDALGTLLATLEAELRDLLPHAVRHADAVDADAGAFVLAVNTPTRENVDRAEAALAVALARVGSGRCVAASEADPGAIDREEYRPATWFRKGMAARLRQAASKTRKTKRVATRTVDGVVCYSVADARRWWPADVPKDV